MSSGDAIQDICEAQGIPSFVCELGLVKDVIERYLRNYIDKVSEGNFVCGKVLNRASTDADRVEARAFNNELNDLLRSKAAEY
jgi:hypothetical protein